MQNDSNCPGGACAEIATAALLFSWPVVGAEILQTEELADFLRDSRPGDYLLCTNPCDSPELRLVRANNRYFLYWRRGNGNGAWHDSRSIELNAGTSASANRARFQ